MNKFDKHEDRYEETISNFIERRIRQVSFYIIERFTFFYSRFALMYKIWR